MSRDNYRRSNDESGGDDHALLSRPRTRANGVSTSSSTSLWRAARDALDKARQANWSDTGRAEAAWSDVAAMEARLLAPADHMTGLVEKLRYLLELTEVAGVRHPAPSEKPWKVRLLDLVIKDAVRLAVEVEQNQRCESLRQHAARLGGPGELASRLAELKRDLNETRAERDAAYAALERANGLCQALGRNETPEP